MTIEEQMAELVDRIAAEPTTKIDPRAWDQLRIYAPQGLRKRPVAFRYKDGVDTWVYTENELLVQDALNHRPRSLSPLFFFFFFFFLSYFCLLGFEEVELPLNES